MLHKAGFLPLSLRREDLNSRSATRGDITEETACLLVIIWLHRYQFVSSLMLRGEVRTSSEFSENRMKYAHVLIASAGLATEHMQISMLLFLRQHRPVPQVSENHSAADIACGISSVKLTVPSYLAFLRAAKVFAFLHGLQSRIYHVRELYLLPLVLTSNPDRLAQLNLYQCIPQYVQGDLIQAGHVQIVSGSSTPTKSPPSDDCHL